MKSIDYQEFRPTILFLVKFIGIYLVGNLLYGVFVNSYNPVADPITQRVTMHTAWVISMCGWPVSILDHPQNSTTSIVYNNKIIISVYEGCNAVNTMIIFVAFVAAFSPLSKKMIVFILVGLLVIYATNLIRIGLLFFISEYRPEFMYFTHKYFFTAILYVIIFVLWILWVWLEIKQKKGNA